MYTQKIHNLRLERIKLKQEYNDLKESTGLHYRNRQTEGIISGLTQKINKIEKEHLFMRELDNKITVN